LETLKNQVWRNNILSVRPKPKIPSGSYLVEISDGKSVFRKHWVKD
jgi:hypothetical protein